MFPYVEENYKGRNQMKGKKAKTHRSEFRRKKMGKAHLSPFINTKDLLLWVLCKSQDHRQDGFECITVKEGRKL